MPSIVTSEVILLYCCVIISNNIRLCLTSGVENDCPIDWSLYESVSKEKALIKCLLEKYKNYTTVGRPVTNTSDMITVEFGLSLIQIMDVDEKNQVLETNVWYTYVSMTFVRFCRTGIGEHPVKILSYSGGKCVHNAFML